MVEEKVLINGTKCRLTEKGMENWFGGYSEHVKQDLKETIFIATGENIKKMPYFNIVYPTGSFPIKEHWGTEMWLRYDEFEIIKSRKLEDWL